MKSNKHDRQGLCFVTTQDLLLTCKPQLAYLLSKDPDFLIPSHLLIHCAVECITDCHLQVGSDKMAQIISSLGRQSIAPALQCSGFLQ
jgi:hypothetical protein